MLSVGPEMFSNCCFPRSDLWCNTWLLDWRQGKHLGLTFPNLGLMADGTGRWEAIVVPNGVKNYLIQIVTNFPQFPRDEKSDRGRKTEKRYRKSTYCTVQYSTTILQYSVLVQQIFQLRLFNSDKFDLCFFLQ